MRPQTGSLDGETYGFAPINLLRITKRMAFVSQSLPKGLLRQLVRLPIGLYQLHLGWLLDSRFLLLIHTGRKSGLPRRTVLEVVHHDNASDAYFIASAWGKKANWFRNIQKTPQVTVVVGRRRFATTARQVSIEEATQVLFTYARQHPRAFRGLARLMMGRRLQGTETDCYTLAQSVPLVVLPAIETQSRESAELS